MSDGYGQGYDPTRRVPRGYEGRQPYTAQQPDPYAAGQAPGGGKSPNGARIDHAQYAAGVAATALVAAVAGYVITAIINAVYSRNNLGSAWGGGPQDPWDSALIGGVGALVAGVFLWVFLSLVPSPMTFFRWIAGLFVFASVVLPFLSETGWIGSLITAALNGFLGLLVISLLTAVAAKTAGAH
ncbi:MAG: hypothetical protein L0H59_02440 [Tomitella sp.]|nr:hypothetical protein [Tomitella sp.]